MTTRLWRLPPFRTNFLLTKAVRLAALAWNPRWSMY